ncbi:hypothetical protein DKG77_06290 [Flagellimonas aquimarina]|uniref:HTH araC/xylS-type domain-containing protein n=1 Tax=Flagellimonas aquimarina TaxID=2201895 RepID=A0A316LJY0_9FLAO|nr:helix-turn-helix domain-containing protein [Allomuricauda koreensis]PWL40420.1 hypothetical protein DKG77_06290 [Allomuricauda koreensis]
MEGLFNIEFDFWAVILLFGSFQGVFLAGMLLTGRQKGKSIFFLALLILIVATNLFNYLLLHTNLYTFVPHLVHVSTPFLMLLGPCYYFYIKSILERKIKLQTRDLLHFAPFLLGALFFAPFYLLNSLEKTELLTYQLSFLKAELTPEVAIFLLAQIVVSFGYIYYSIRMLKKLKERNKIRSFENKYHWLIKFSRAFLIFWSVDFLGVVWYFVQGEIDRRVYYITMLCCAVAINMIVLFFYRNSKVFLQVFLNNENSKYETSKVSNSDLQKHLIELVSYMESERPYLDAGLSLQKLSDHLKKPKYLISQILNIELGKSFYEFINEYRFNEVKHRLKDPKYRDLTILAIAYDSGFNNKNTFNKVFKKQAGITPSEYIQNNLKVKS